MHSTTISLKNTIVSQAAAIGQPKWYEQFGTGNAPPGCSTYTDVNGPGNGTANITFRGNSTGQVVVPASGSLRINLKGLLGELDAINEPLSLVSIASLYMELVTPGPGNEITIGPAGNASNANLGFNACGSFDVRGKFLADDPLGPGWPVTSGAGNITLLNPGTGNQSVYIRVTGTGG